MRRLPYQQPNNLLRWTWQPLQWPRNYAYGALKIQPFALKLWDSINDHPNYNVPNANHRYNFNNANPTLILKYGTTKMLPHHMNSILVEAWDALKVSARNIIREIFLKKDLLPLSPTGLTMNNHTYSVSFQVSPRTKAKKPMVYHTTLLHLLR